MELLKHKRSRFNTATASKKHLFKMFDTQPELNELDVYKQLCDLLDLFNKRCKTRTFPQIKRIGPNLFTFEYSKPKRLNYTCVDLGRVKFYKLNFRSLYDMIDYDQVLIDNYLK